MAAGRKADSPEFLQLNGLRECSLQECLYTRLYTSLCVALHVLYKPDHCRLLYTANFTTPSVLLVYLLSLTTSSAVQIWTVYPTCCLMQA